jgi:hypothetical protein
MLIAYVFLGLCNWSPDIGKWTSFSRFLFGAVGVILFISSYAAMVTTVRNFKRNIKQSETIA